MTDKIANTSPSTLAMPFDYGNDAGVGMDITMDDLKIPFIILAQTESKVLIDGSPKYVPGGAVGDLLNSATKTYTPGKEGYLLVPAVKENSIVEFLPNNQGFVAKHSMDSAEAKMVANKVYKLDNGNELVRTKTLVCVQLNEDLSIEGFVVVPFSSSKLAAWTEYFTQIHGSKLVKSAPLFANLIRLTSFDDTNREGKRYKNYVMSPARDESGNLTSDKFEANAITSLLAPDSPAYLAAKELSEQWQSGAASEDREGNLEGTEAGDTHF